MNEQQNRNLLQSVDQYFSTMIEDTNKNYREIEIQDLNPNQQVIYHGGKVRYLSVILFLIFFTCRTHFAALDAYKREVYIQNSFLIVFSVGYIFGAAILPGYFNTFKFKYRKILMVFALKILLISVCFAFDAHHQYGTVSHSKDWVGLLTDLYVVYGSFLYGWSLSGIMILQGKFTGECGQLKGQRLEYFWANYFSIAFATLVHSLYHEYLFDYVILPKLFMYLIGVVLVIFALIYFFPDGQLIKDLANEEIYGCCPGTHYVPIFGKLNIFLFNSGFCMILTLGSRVIIFDSNIDGIYGNNPDVGIELLMGIGQIVGLFFFYHFYKNNGIKYALFVIFFGFAGVFLILGFTFTNLVLIQMGSFFLGMNNLGNQLILSLIITNAFNNNIKAQSTYRFMYGIGMLIGAIIIAVINSKQLEEQ